MSGDVSKMIWIVEDDRAVRFVLAAALREAGFEPREFGDAESALASLQDETPGLIFTDVRMPGASGLKLLERIAGREQHVPVIVMSAFTDVASTASAYRLGAFDYLSKPFDLDQAVAAARRALAQPRSTSPVAPVPQHADAELIGRSAPMRELFRAIGRVAASGLGALITGETGTGKELVARALHRESARAAQPFIALNTAAIPAELLESELFGHEAGAFTGAARRHAGRFEQAEGGTLFLDEIGDMPLALQTRLLRVLAAGEFYRVGGRELLRADARVIAATHQDLDGKVQRGEFRADLLHRLDVVRLHVPALREHRDDVPPLAEHFLARAAADAGAVAKRFSPAALGALRDHDWPGNVRQLENLCRRLVVLSSGREIGVGDLPAALVARAPPRELAGWSAALRVWAEQSLAAGAENLHTEALAELERVLLAAALAAHDGHRQHAAKSLGLSRNTMTRKLGSSRRTRR
ncbi:MAG: nitrogen regulation protein NR(I) [Dokdonella sp.]|uniref:nitrogen regulation protein NR(I) n=1 Tax=Dokdonella sp. TaxID=2291710 RepID=UPI0032679178